MLAELSSTPRLPLRERCKVTLRVDTSTKKSKCRAVRQKKHDPPVASCPLNPLVIAKPSRPMESSNKCMGQIIPGLIVAFHNEHDKGIRVADGGRQFSHVISIAPSKSAPGRVVEYSSVYDDETYIRALHLTVPYRQSSTDPTRLSLSSSQLRAARDFLTLALPYTPESTPSDWHMLSIRLLITTPYSRSVDAVCIAAVYLGFTSGEDVLDILDAIDDNDELPNAWKGRVSEADADIVQMVAEEERFW